MNLATSYLGLTLRTPLVASPSPLNADVGHLRRLEDAGIGAVVLPSLFQEQLEAERDRLAAIHAQAADNNPEARGYLADAGLGPYGVGPEGYLDLVRRAKDALDVPVIASINAASVSGWVDYAAMVEEAGADALELNIYYVPVDITQSGAQIEQRYLDVVAAVRRAVSIPVVAKIPSFLSSVGHVVAGLAEEGAAGVVLFNRLIEPDIDLLRLKLSRELELSSPPELRLPLLWIAILYRQVRCSLAASTGVDNAEDVLKLLLAGADVVMTTASILRHGPDHVHTLLDGLRAWLDSRRLDSLDRVRGVMSRSRIKEPGAYERANYISLIQTYSREHR